MKKINTAKENGGSLAGVTPTRGKGGPARDPTVLLMVVPFLLCLFLFLLPLVLLLLFLTVARV